MNHIDTACSNERVKWIDVSRFWGMFFIYLGHLGNTAGLAHPWVFSFHVPLFFFLSGCVENYNQRGLRENMKHKAITTMLPFYCFGLLSTVFESINSNSVIQIRNNLYALLLGGVRNSMSIGWGLWFLTCLFVIQIVFSLLKRAGNKAVITAACLGIFLAADLLIKPSPIVSPHWYYNLDSACYYLVFYGFGWLLFPLINRLLPDHRVPARIIKASMTMICLFYSAAYFYGKDLLAPLAGLHPLLHSVHGVISPWANIWLVIYISYLLQGEQLKYIGRNSLYLCGNEYLVKELVPLTMSMIGLPLALNTPIQAYLYSFLLMIVVNKIFVPLEKPLLRNLQGILSEYIE